MITYLPRFSCARPPNPMLYSSFKSNAMYLGWQGMLYQGWVCQITLFKSCPSIYCQALGTQFAGTHIRYGPAVCLIVIIVNQFLSHTKTNCQKEILTRLRNIAVFIFHSIFTRTRQPNKPGRIKNNTEFNSMARINDLGLVK